MRENRKLPPGLVDTWCTLVSKGSILWSIYYHYFNISMHKFRQQESEPIFQTHAANLVSTQPRDTGDRTGLIFFSTLVPAYQDLSNTQQIKREMGEGSKNRNVRIAEREEQKACSSSTCLFIHSELQRRQIRPLTSPTDKKTKAQEGRRLSQNLRGYWESVNLLFLAEFRSNLTCPFSYLGNIFPSLEANKVNQ